MFIAKTDFYKKLSGQRSHKIAQKVEPFMPENGQILDFGCGNLFTAKTLAALRNDLSITGIDVIRDQNLHLDDDGQLTFLQYEGDHIPFEDGHFDAAIASSVMHHTHDPEFFLGELQRVLKPGGQLVLVEEMYINFLDRIWISAQDFLLNKLKKGVPVPLEFRSHKHYQQEFERQGWEVCHGSHIRPGFPYQHHYVYVLEK